MNNLTKRAITGVLFITLLIGSIAFSSATFFILFLVITIAGMLEFYNLSRMAKAMPQKYTGVLVGVMFYILSFLYAIEYIKLKVFVILIPFFVLIYLNELYSNNKRPFTNIAYTLLGILYIAVPFSLFNFFVFNAFTGANDMVAANTENQLVDSIVNFFYILKPDNNIIYSSNILLGFFFLLWANDTGAYIFGVSFGKHRLFERVSPKKSWEGSIGGAITTFGIGFLLSHYFTILSISNWLIISGIIVIMGTYGDLIESLFKRSIGVKDSGNILPGHGGILDRFDSVLLASPIVFTYLQFIS